ncbi:MAG: heme-copper oxidase subunit III [Rhodospirillaceae bacterium]|nr:heme-copper oxidase subunit III [Rhodospirillaceae bacterium]
MAEVQEMAPLEAQRALPVGTFGRRASGWYGMWGLIATEAALFAYLLFSYFYLAFHVDRPWPPEGLPHLALAGPNTLLLLASSVVLWFGERAIRRGARGLTIVLIVATFVMGLAFVGVQGLEWHNKPFSFHSHTYAALYFTITGFHMAHVIAGLLVLAGLALWSGLGYFDSRRHAVVSIGALYWHFVDAVWIAVFLSLYITPYLAR